MLIPFTILIKKKMNIYIYIESFLINYIFIFIYSTIMQKKKHISIKNYEKTI